MIKVKLVKTTGEDLLELCGRPGVGGHPGLNENNAHKVEAYDHTMSVVDVYGKVWAILGVFEYKPGFFEAWMLVDPHAGPKMLAITRIVKEGLKNHPAKKIEAMVEIDFDRGHRFVGMLGFKQKAPCVVLEREGQGLVSYILHKEGET